jgi:hypothetical protein
MSSALFGILQLDKGEPLGYESIAGLIQAWVQDAGGFAMVGLVVYLIYAFSTPTDKSQSEKIRVPVSFWMVVCAALGLVCYAGVLALLITNKGAAPEPPPPPPGMPYIPPRPVIHKELRPLLLTVAGLFALLGIGEPFARDMLKVFRRNLSLGSSGLRRFGRSLAHYSAHLFTPRRVIALVAALVTYGLVGVAIYALGSQRLFGIWAGWLYVAISVFVCAMLLLLLFEAEGPVWAIAKLSFKEAVRSQLLWIFLLILVPFAFRNMLLSKVKAADELRALVDLTSVFLAFLILLPALLLSSFGIPNDIKNLNIYTVVTKPVERVEVVFGRFVGYVSLLTLVLIAMTGVTLVLIANTKLTAKAMDETYKARVPVRGKLDFKSRKQEFEGTNVGREFDYRKYIGGHEESPQRAVWHFNKIPAELATPEGDRVPVEFTFDIYRLTKGVQNEGVRVNFTFVTYQAPQRPPTQTEGGSWHWQDPKREEEYNKAVKALRDRGIAVDSARPGDKEAWDAASKLAEEYGFFEIRGKEVYDYTVMGVEVPAGLIRNALSGTPPKIKTRDKKGLEVETTAPRLSVYVKCESAGQLLGMAEPDLYLLEYEQPFEVNFLKGMVGRWCQLCIIVGLAVALSTYLSGVLTLIVTAGIFVVGFFPEMLNDVAAGRNVGGGPFESISRLVKAEQPTTPLSDSASVKALTIFDKGAAWGFRRVQNLIPDVDSLAWSDFVAEGFNINTEYLVVNLLVTFGYLLPWGILAYYLMKSREVAA